MSNREAPNQQEKGTRAYREKIHKDSKLSDAYGNLPFTFSKPKKSTGARRDVLHVCEHCEQEIEVSKKTYSVVCFRCKKLTRVTANFKDPLPKENSESDQTGSQK